MRQRQGNRLLRDQSGTKLTDPTCASCPPVVCVRGAIEGYGWLGTPMALSMIEEEKQRYEACLTRAAAAGYREVQPPLEFHLGDTIYLVKPGMSNPAHVARCSSSRMSSSLVGRQDQASCIATWLSRGHVQAAEPECAYWRVDAKSGEEMKIRESCKDNPPDWALRRPEVAPSVAVGPALSRPVAVGPRTSPLSSQTGVLGTWSGMLHGQQRSYPLTITFRNDGTYQATSATLNAGSFDGTW